MGEIGGQSVELRLPKSAVLVDPARGVLHGARHEPAVADTTPFRVRHEAGPLEHAQMLVDAGEGHAKRARKVRDRRVARGQPGEDRAARGIGERGEGAVECGIAKLNHVVKFKSDPERVKSPPGLPPHAPRRFLPPVIYTIGHSTRELGEFLGLLTAHRVTQVMDVRRYPGSRRHPQFVRDALATALQAIGVAYHHEPELGGRRAARRDSANTAWRSAGFRGYADYMETPAFEHALARLREVARARPTAILCAEAVPWRCHRHLIADALLARGEDVSHILSATRVDPHRLSAHAQVLPGGLLRYPAGPPDQIALC